jgi:hypothetical protein
MEKEFIPYEQVSSLIALGFNEPVIAHRQDGLDICLLKQPEVLLTDLSMILYQQAFRWFREKHDLYHVITIADLGKYETGNPDFQCAIYSKDPVLITNMNKYNTYEEAELACLEKLIEIVELKKEE